MKYIRLFTLLLLTSVIFGSCAKWLDGAIPKDKNIDEVQYSTETGINSVLNGLYRNMISENLYGGQMTMTTVELLAHYYYYAENVSGNQNLIPYNQIATFNYAGGEPKVRFTRIWKAFYDGIFRINHFIENVSKSNVLTAKKQNIVLGEAYALRAFLHFDLFRLFGSNTLGLPYNKSAEVIPHEKETPENYFKFVLDDIKNAKNLLEDDPIITGGIKDLTESTNATETEIFDEYFRNYRMNIYAVNALEARILLFRGDAAQAAAIAQNLIDNVFGTDKPFNWVDRSKANDFIFYSEVIFGVQNQDIYTRWSGYTSGSRPGAVYTVEQNNLKDNILKFDNIVGSDISAWEDIRIRQWKSSKLSGQYVSSKFDDYSLEENNPIKYLQPLIRMAEMFYIVAENQILSGQVGNAVRTINTVRSHRGVQEATLPTDPDALTAEQAYGMLEAEYYKEFFAEGQAFFYLKRLNANKIYNGNKAGYVNITDYTVPSSGSIFVVPIPESENIF